MGEANRRGTRADRIAQAQAVMTMRRDEAIALITAPTAATPTHAAKEHVKAIERAERAHLAQQDPRTRAARAKLAAITLAAIAMAPPTFQHITPPHKALTE